MFEFSNDTASGNNDKNHDMRILQNVEVDHFKLQHAGTNTCLQFRYKILSRGVLKDCN